MQPVPYTGWRLFLELDADLIMFLEPRLQKHASHIFFIYILNKLVPHFQKRVLVTILVAVIPLMLTEST